MKLLSFDIEIAHLAPEGVDLHAAIDQLGITCYAYAWREGSVKSDAGHGYNDDGTPAPRMSQAECKALVYELEAKVRDGFTLLTHNGISFDFQVLAYESGLHAACAALAAKSVDTMFHFFCAKGFPVSLAAVAAGLGLKGKTEGMSGALAPEMWANGEYAKVLEYVAQDCVATLAVAEEVQKRNYLAWITRTGKRKVLPIRAWLTAEQALQLPEPDNSWMAEPWTRARLIGWMPQPVTDEVEFV